jgi:RNA polymerase sigma factor (sigma-70 family)
MELGPGERRTGRKVPVLEASRPEPTDGDLVARSCTDPAAFVALFERHFDVVYGYLARRVGPALAEELAAETFTTAFEKRRRFDPDVADARPWIFGIAVNLLRTRYRKERRELRALARTGVDPVLGEDQALLEPVERHLAARELAAALARLGAKDREILLLYFWADLSYEAIAVALDIPVGTVRSRLSRARGRLRELFAASGQSGARPRPAVAAEKGHG